MRKTARWLLLSLACVGFDQLTKHWIIATFGKGESIAVTGFFNLALTHNTGAAFSFLSDASGWQNGLFIAIAATAAVVIVRLLHKYSHSLLFSFSLSLILGGALGNLWDRATLGYVVDFLDFHHGPWHFPAFNAADSCITSGAALLIWDSFTAKTPKAK